MNPTTIEIDSPNNQKGKEQSFGQPEAEKLRADALELLNEIIVRTKTDISAVNFICIVRGFSALKAADELVRKYSPRTPARKTIPPEVIAQIEREVLGINREPTKDQEMCDEPEKRL